MPVKKYIDQNALRLAALHGLDVLDSGTEKVYDDITQLTADICEAPVCLISLVDEDRQWFKSETGLGSFETVIEQSICSHAVNQNDYLEIYDTHLDPRTVNNPLCQGDRPFRFYAGAILRTVEGIALGTLCILDYEPRELTELQRRVLHVHAKSVMTHLEFTDVLLKRVKSPGWAFEQIIKFDEEIDLFGDVRARYETLTSREKEVLNLIAGHTPSLSSKEIARKLGISFRTVHHHRANVMTKMELGSVAELIAVCFKAGIYK